MKNSNANLYNIMRTDFPSVKLTNSWMSRGGKGGKDPCATPERNPDCVFIQCPLVLVLSIAPVWGGVYVVRPLQIPRMGVGEVRHTIDMYMCIIIQTNLLWHESFSLSGDLFEASAAHLWSP